MASSTNRLSTQINVAKLLSDLKECTQELSSDFTNSNIPIDDDNTVCQRFCAKLEQFLLLGFSERSGLFGRKKSYWEFFKASLASSGRGGIDSGIKFANNNPEVRSSVGRGRAFLRYCLAHGCLGDALQHSLLDPEAVATWYLASAPLREPNLAQQLVDVAYELADVHFDLAPGGHDLDGGWPTFARRQFSPGGLSWRPLSRSTSIASFSSFSNSFQDPSSPPPAMGGMESLPEGRRGEDNMWWGDASGAPPAPRTQNQEVQTDPTESASSQADSTSSQLEEILLTSSDHPALSSLISHHKTELRALSERLHVSEGAKQRLESETEMLAAQSGQEAEALRLQIAEFHGVEEKLAQCERECGRLREALAESRDTCSKANEAESDRATEVHELKMKLAETRSENNTLKTQVSELEVQCSQLGAQVREIGQLRASLERSALECQKLRAEMGGTQELSGQLLEAQADVEKLQTQLKVEGGRMQQAKWEMTSLQTCVDNLLKENTQLRNDLTQISSTMTESRDKFTTNELYVEKLTEQVTALKDVVSIGKQMLGMRDAEVEQLQRKVQNLEDMLETEREKNSVLSQAFSPECSSDLKREYQKQLENFSSLREIYTKRTELMGLENQALKDTLGDKDRQIELMEKRYADLLALYNPIKDAIAEKEAAASGLQRRVCDLTEDCRALNNQLTMISNLFTELSKSDVDVEKLKELQNAMSDGLSDSDTTSNLSRVWGALSELLEANGGELPPPQPVEGSEGCYKSVNTPFGPRVVISVSQTFLRLRDLILEKKVLQKEVGQLRNLNTHLETKLQQQEKRLSLVLQELKKTWGVVNKMRSQHSQLRNSEAILRYDLQQKRKVVNELKEELEYCRDIWQQAREKTTESEEQWRSLRDEFASRRRRPLLADDSTEMNSGESGYSDGRGEDDSAGSSTSDCEENTADSEPSSDSKSPAIPSPDILPADARPDSFMDSSLSAAGEVESEYATPEKELEDLSPEIKIEEVKVETVAVLEEAKLETAAAVEAATEEEPKEKAEKIEVAVVSAPSLSTGAIRKTPTVPSEPATAPRVDVEEILDARAARLKRLEEQCSQLFKRVVRTSNMSVAIANRLEELHEHYGDGEDSKRRSPRSSESDANIPPAPPMPTVIPNTRLPTEMATTDPNFFEVPEPVEESRIPTPPPLPPPPRPERLRRRAQNAAERCDTQQAGHDRQASEAQAARAAELEAERAKSERLSRELTALGVELSTTAGQLEELQGRLEARGRETEQAEDSLTARQRDCEELTLRVQQLSDRERELEARLAASEEQAGSRMAELQQLQTDTKHLHEAIIKLTREKDALFKEGYALKQAARAATWQADQAVSACSACGVSFSLLVRRHHCRPCGRIFCGACSSHWVQAHGDSSRRSRACSECHSKSQVSSSELPAEQPPFHSPSLASTTDAEETAVSGCAVSGEDVEDDDEEEEEDFSVISEEEVVLSQCVPYSPNPEILQYWKACEIQSGLTIDVSTLLSEGRGVQESVWVRAGVILAVPLLLRAEDCSPQVNVSWEFTTEPKCIAFSVLYKKDADIPTENSSILVPTTRVNSHLHAIKGRLRARREGLYTLMFDNSYSRFTGKKVNFSLTCEVGSGSGRSSAGPASPLRVAQSPSRDLCSPQPPVP